MYTAWLWSRKNICTSKSNLVFLANCIYYILSHENLEGTLTQRDSLTKICYAFIGTVGKLKLF
jgi:hypothetical protein